MGTLTVVISPLIGEQFKIKCARPQVRETMQDAETSHVGCDGLLGACAGASGTGAAVRMPCLRSSDAGPGQESARPRDACRVHVFLTDVR